MTATENAAAELRATVRGIAAGLKPALAARFISGRFGFRTTNRGSVVVTVDCGATQGNLRQDTATAMHILREACVAAGLEAEYGSATEVTIRARAAAQQAA